MKGYIQILEATIAAVIILSAMVYIFTFKETQAETPLYSISYNCLKGLDNKGTLRYYAYNDMQSSLENDLRGCIPQLADFSVKVCETADCIYQVPENKTVVLASYLISGDVKFQPKLINLWVWSK